MKTGFTSFVVFSLVFFVFSSPGAVLYVDLNSTNPVSPYAGWSTAATNIQDAIDAAANGDQVWVTNGVYAVGGKSMDGVITNRVSVDKAITAQSVNGPDVTVIQGGWDPVSTNGLGAVRCAWLTNNAKLSGFMLSSGGTRAVSPSVTAAMSGGGVWGASVSAVVENCVITADYASYKGGGAYQVTLTNCILMGNHAVGSGRPGVGVGLAGSGGGAANCSLANCLIVSNYADEWDGGGVDTCKLKTCALVGNSSFLNGGAANAGSLVNCTVTGNISSGYSTGYGAAVYGAALTNCIVWGNFQRTSNPNTNYASCTLTYSCADPLAAGNGNISSDPQLLADGVHLSQTSPCIGAGSASAVSGTDIDGQSWNNPPSIGCDEWQPAPVIAFQPSYQIDLPVNGLAFNIVAAGQSSFNYFWSRNGALIQDDGHHSNSGTANPIINNFGPNDAGLYQVVVSNAFGFVTSQTVQVVIHVVDTAGVNPVPPYSTWTTAATNIQDAVDIAVAGDIVLVTNGVYVAGGKVMVGDLANRVTVDKPLTVTSVNGYTATTIQGVWDPVSTNGPLAVRCAWLTNGAVLSGFTLANGATRATGDSLSGGPLESGGGVWCASTNGVVANCLLTNNSAIYGGGIANGTLNNSLVPDNQAIYGGGAYRAVLNNCTVVANYCNTYHLSSSGAYHRFGAGGYDCVARNSILLNNFSMDFSVSFYDVNDNYDYDLPYSQFNPSGVFVFCCTDPLVFNTGDIDADPQFLDSFHISTTSPCRGAGSALYASATDLDGEPWANPPSIGCDEAVVSNLVGPLLVNILAYQTNLLVNRSGSFQGLITGRAAYVTWSFGDGPTFTNFGVSSFHQWTNAGNYPITFTAFNNDNPAGVSTNLIFPVLPLNVPQLQSPGLMTNGFQFQFAGQWNANYTVEYATNLAPPVAWQTLQSIFYNTSTVIQINDSAPTNAARFYRVLAQ